MNGVERSVVFSRFPIDLPKSPIDPNPPDPILSILLTKHVQSLLASSMHNYFLLARDVFLSVVFFTSAYIFSLTADRVKALPDANELYCVALLWFIYLCIGLLSTVNYMSLVPMQHVFWQLAKNVRVTNSKVYIVIRSMLIRSLAYTKFVATWAESKLNMIIKIYPKMQGEGALFCKPCMVEVWNIIFVRDAEVFEVWCANCVRQQKDVENLHAIQHISFPDLVTIFNDFQPHMINKAPLTA